jgi:hypothetical protein
MSRRALTLLEVLIALTLLVALGAIAFPAMMRSLGGRAFDATGDVIVNHLLLARATAMEQGELIEVAYLTEPARLVARRFEPALLEAPAAPGAEEGFGAPPTWDTAWTAEDEAPAPIAEGWAVRALPRGLELRNQPPASLDENDPEAMLAAMEAEALDEAAPEQAPMRIAVYLPDGSAMIAGDFWLLDEEGRSARLRVSPWTGLPALESVARAAPGEEALDEDEDEDEDFEDEEEDEFDADAPDEEPRRPAADESGGGPAEDDEPMTGPESDAGAEDGEDER